MLVIPEKTGRLGNQLTLFAHVIAASIDDGVTVVNTAFVDYADLFEGSRYDLFSRFPAQGSLVPPTPPLRRYIYHAMAACAKVGMPRVTASGADVFSAARADRRLLATLVGYNFRNVAALSKHAGHVRDYFRPVEAIKKRVDAHVQHARAQADVLIGIHIRQGDFRDWRGGASYFEYSRYASVMRHLESGLKGKRVTFLVCSDEPVNDPSFADLSIAWGPGDAIGDMYSLAQCDYIVNAYRSTFAGWASFYGEKPLFSISDADSMPTLDDFAVCRDLPG